MKIRVINGPNLNMLGQRETQIYGKKSYDDLIERINQVCFIHNIDVSIMQSNHEGEIIDAIHQCHFDNVDALIINPGAYTHYSYAIRDALAAVDVFKVEVHISDIDEREPFRKTNVIRDVVDDQIKGLGFDSYIEAIQVVRRHKA